MPRAFVLLASPRSGSTWLVDLLSGHPQLVMYSELFVNTTKAKPTFAGDKEILLWNEWIKTRPLSSNRLCRQFYALDYLQHVFSIKPHFRREQAGIGFKLMYGNVEQYPAIALYLMAKQVRVVHLVRENLIDSVISRELARKSGTYHSTAQAQQPELNLQPDALLANLDELYYATDRARKWLRRLRLPTFELSYEDLRRDPSTLSGVQRFLGVDERPLTSELRKLSSRPHSEVLTNCGDVDSVLANTRYEKMLRR